MIRNSVNKSKKHWASDQAQQIEDIVFVSKNISEYT